MCVAFGISGPPGPEGPPTREVAVTPVECQALSRKTFWKVLQHHPRDRKHFLRMSAGWSSILKMGYV